MAGGLGVRWIIPLNRKMQRGTNMAEEKKQNPVAALAALVFLVLLLGIFLVTVCEAAWLRILRANTTWRNKAAH